MNFVIIPTDFFLREARQEYADIRTRLFQELLQNATDAGASVIRLTVDDKGYSCEDNGRGMTRERLVEAMLTMGGSIKEAGSTGGFGAAKKLLLFAHESFKIVTNGIAVEGKGLSYSFVSSLPTRGTTVSAVFSPGFGSNLFQKCSDLLSKCDFSGRCKVYLNGTLFTNYYSAPEFKVIPGLGSVCGYKKETDNSYVSVRMNGLFMFHRYAHELNRDVIVEVSGKSVDVFAQNRDGFRDVAATLFDKLISEIVVDKKSFIKTKPRRWILNGVEDFIEQISHKVEVMLAPEIQKVVNDFLAVQSVQGKESIQALMNAVQAASVTMTQTPENIKAVEIIKEITQKKLSLATDFHFDLANSTYTKVPDKFIPNSGKPKYTLMAALWKVCITEVLKANNISLKFVIGFTLDSEVVATHQKVDGISRFLLNPTSDKIDVVGDNQTKVINFLTTAIHEIVHSQSYGPHDENFLIKFHEFLTPTLVKAPGWRLLVKMAKSERV